LAFWYINPFFNIPYSPVLTQRKVMEQALNLTNLKARISSIEAILQRHVDSWLQKETMELDQPVGLAGLIPFPFHRP
jgi:hypothetical protein